MNRKEGKQVLLLKVSALLKSKFLRFCEKVDFEKVNKKTVTFRLATSCPPFFAPDGIANYDVLATS